MYVAMHVKYAFKSSFVYKAKHKNVLSVRRMPAWLNVLFFVFTFHSSSISFLTRVLLCRSRSPFGLLFDRHMNNAYTRATWIDSLTSILKLTHPSFSLGFAKFHSEGFAFYLLLILRLVPFFSAFFLFFAKHKHMLVLHLKKWAFFFLTCSIHLLTCTMRKSSFSSELEYCFQSTHTKKNDCKEPFSMVSASIPKWLSQ